MTAKILTVEATDTAFTNYKLLFGLNDRLTNYLSWSLFVMTINHEIDYFSGIFEFVDRFVRIQRVCC